MARRGRIQMQGGIFMEHAVFEIAKGFDLVLHRHCDFGRMLVAFEIGNLRE